MTGSLKNTPDSALTIQGFPPEADYGKIDVLRYMPLDRFLSLLEFEAMWFSRVGALQDKFECTNPEGARAFVLKLAEDREAVEKCKSLGLWEHMVATAEHARAGDDGRSMFLVSCWFMGKSESAEMWRDYGGAGKGIALRSTAAQLAAAFEIPADFRPVSRVGRITYVDFKSHKLDARGEDITQVAFIKDKMFEIESEVRVLTPNFFHSGCLNSEGSCLGSVGFCPDIQGRYIKCDLQRLIRSVIVGPNSYPQFRALMKRIIGRYGFNIDVEYSQIAPPT